MPLATIPEAVEAFQAGRFVIIVDDEDRENEGDLAVAAAKVTPEHISFMAHRAGGLICTPVISSRLEELGIEPMVGNNTSRLGTAFTVSIEARDLVTTGISAHDRVATIRHLLDPDARPADFSKPGHTFPLQAVEGGVLQRAGHTEAAVDLARLAGLYPAGVICEVMDEDGTMARLPALQELAAEVDIPVVTIKDLIAYRRRHEKLVRHRGSKAVQIAGRTWTVHAYEDLTSGTVDLALVLGDISPDRPTLVRVHSCCLTGDIYGSARCDCGAQLEAAIDAIAREGHGLLVYLTDHEGRGIGLFQKLRAYRLQDEGLDTVQANEALDQPADSRDYGIGMQIIADLGVRELRLMTNNPRKLIGLDGFGLTVAEQVPIRIPPNEHNERYLRTKKEKLGHLL